MQYRIATENGNRSAKQVFDRVTRLAIAEKMSATSSRLLLMANIGLGAAAAVSIAMIIAAAFFQQDTLLSLLPCALLGGILWCIRAESLPKIGDFKTRIANLLAVQTALTDLLQVSFVSHMGKTVVVLRQAGGFEHVFEIQPSEEELQHFLRAWRLAGRDPITIGYENYPESVSVPFCDDARLDDDTKGVTLGMVAIIGSDAPVPYELHCVHGSPDQMRQRTIISVQTHIKNTMTEMGTEGGARTKYSVVSGRAILSRIRPELMVGPDSPLRLLRINTSEQDWVKYPA